MSGQPFDFNGEYLKALKHFPEALSPKSDSFMDHWQREEQIRQRESVERQCRIASKSVPATPIPQPRSGRRQLILTRGLPGSGKTTWAREYVAAASGRIVRISRDDIRAMLGLPYDRDNEAIVVAIRNKAMRVAFDARRDVLLDETFCRDREILDALTVACAEHMVDVAIAEFDTDRQTCLDRIEYRGDSLMTFRAVVERMEVERAESAGFVESVMRLHRQGFAMLATDAEARAKEAEAAP